MKDLMLLPNRDKFKFIAVLKNGQNVLCEIFKNEKGVYTFKEFKDSKAWIPFTSNQKH